MNMFWTVVVPLVEKGPKPEDVKAGWVAFGLFLLLAVAVAFLGFSLAKHLRRARTNFDTLETLDKTDDDPPRRVGT